MADSFSPAGGPPVPWVPIAFSAYISSDGFPEPVLGSDVSVYCPYLRPEICYRHDLCQALTAFQARREFREQFASDQQAKGTTVACLKMLLNIGIMSCMSLLGDLSSYGCMRLVYEIHRWLGQPDSARCLLRQSLGTESRLVLLHNVPVSMAAALATLASTICIKGVACMLSKRSWRSLIAELAVFGVADAVIAAKAVPIWLETGILGFQWGCWTTSWTSFLSILSAIANVAPDTALRFLLRVKHRLVPMRDLENQPIPKMEIPPELDAFFDNAHDLKCPITLELLVDPCILDGKIYERAAITRWVYFHHTVPHSPAQPALVGDIKPCPKMRRLLKQMQREFRLRRQAQVVPI